MNLSALILDDERRGRELLQQLLAIHCPEITTVHMASSLDEAINLLNSFNPDILFLDIRLDDNFGLDIIPFLPHPAPHLIITTAYPEYAIKAIRVNALDYLLKPIIADELITAVKKVTQQLVQHSTPSIHPPATGASPKHNIKITVPTIEGFIFIRVKDILYCKAEGAYTHLYLKENKSVFISTNLKEVEKLLPQNLGFFRVHHAYLINSYEVVKYVKSEGGHVIMRDQSKIAISQRKKSEFLLFIKNFS